MVAIDAICLLHRFSMFYTSQELNFAVNRMHHTANLLKSVAIYSNFARVESGSASDERIRCQSRYGMYRPALMTSQLQYSQKKADKLTF